MIVKGTDEEADLLERCLFNMLPHVQGIFITVTQPNNAVVAIAQKFNAKISYFDWCDDFSAARNYNFAQVPKEFDYIMWSDADDVWRGLNKLKSTIKKHPRMDAFAFLYLYDWDAFKLPTVAHRKTMIIRNDGCATWVGKLHEDLQPNRQLDVQFIEGIERLHITSKDRATNNAKRNVEIAKQEVQTLPNDPRSHWNLANSQFGISDFEGARKTFNDFLATSESDDEKYLAYIRLADVYKGLGKTDEAIKQLQYAIGLTPSFPDAYLQLAYLYFTISNYDKAEHYSLQGLVKRPQVQKMIVYNPRDYDYNPMMLLANIYYHKNRPDLMLPLLKGCLRIYPKDKRLQDLVKNGTQEKAAMGKALIAAEKLSKITDKKKLKVALDNLSPEIASHPTIAVIRNTNFIKTESTGRDLVIYCGNTTHQWNPELFKTKGFGGSEEAVVNLAREWAKLGWHVTVYNNCGNKPYTEHILTQEDYTVTYRPFWEWNYRDKQDVVILWRWAKPLDAEINAPKIFLDLHDVVAEGELTPARLKRVTKVMVKTQFHRSLFPNIPDKHFAVIPNGMDFSTLVSDPPIEKDPYLLINTSSPDRSMDVLPKLFREVKSRVPQARLQWAYGWDIYKASFQGDQKKLDWMHQTQKEMDEAGIETLGRLTQAEVGKLYQKASIFAYPTEFAEIDCISVKKAQAAHCFPVATDFGALYESIKWGQAIPSEKTKDTWNRPYQFHFGLEDEAAQQKWIDACVSVLTNGVDPQAPDMTEFQWPTIANRWNNEFI